MTTEAAADGSARLLAAASGLRAVTEELNTELDVLMRRTAEVGVPWGFDEIGTRVGEAYRPAEKMVVECVESNVEELRGLADAFVGLAAAGVDHDLDGGLEVPRDLAPLVDAVGGTWPESDENGILALGEQWRQFVAPLQRLTAAARTHGEAGLVGDAETVDQLREDYLGPESAVANLETAVHGVGLCASVVDSCATAVLATKIAIIAVLAGHAARVAQAQAAAERTLGASLAELPAHAEVTRLHIARLVSLACAYVDAEGEFDFDDDGDDKDDEHDAEWDDEDDAEEDDDAEENDDAEEPDDAGPVVRVAHRSSFPEAWTEQQRDNAIHRAFRSAELDPDNQYWYGNYRGVQIEGHYDKRSNQPTVAFASRMARDVDNVPTEARISYYYDSKGAIFFGIGDDELDNLGYWVTSDLVTLEACLDALAGVADVAAGVIARWEMTGNIWQARATADDGLRISNEWNGVDVAYAFDDVLAAVVRYWQFLTADDESGAIATAARWERDHDRVHPLRYRLTERQILVGEPDDEDAAEAVRDYAYLRDDATFHGDGLDLRGGDLRGLRLSDANLSHARLDGVNLRECALDSANLVGAAAYGAVFHQAELSYANLRNLSAPAAQFSAAQLRAVDAPHAYLRAANLREAFLADANLAYATLTEADLSDAVFRATRLTDCHLDGAVLTGARGSVHGPVYVADRLLAGDELAAWFRDRGADVDVLS